MNPSSNKASNKESAGLNLPPPVAAGEALPPAQGVEARPEAAGQSPAAPERGPSSAAAGAAAAQTPVPLPPVNDNSGTPPASDVTSASLSGTSGGSKFIKDDDLIEKEWVDKAKRIVEHTRDDPHQQNEQLTMVKADYMKRRYNKTIKVSK